MANEYGPWSEDVEITYDNDFDGSLAQVTNVRAFQVNETTIRISWDAVAGAEFYEVNRYKLDASVLQSDASTEALTIDDDGETFTHELVDGVSYLYRVRAARTVA